MVIVVFLVYQPAWNGGFLFDDDLHLLNNPVLKPGGLGRIWVPGTYVNYWPLTFTAYWLQFKIWGLAPLGFHIVNIALHAAAALLLWRILLHLRVPGAMFAAAIFAVHPVNVESVAWIIAVEEHPLADSGAHLRAVLSAVRAERGAMAICSVDRPLPAVGAGQRHGADAAGRVAGVRLVAARTDRAARPAARPAVLSDRRAHGGHGDIHAARRSRGCVRTACSVELPSRAAPCGSTSGN